MNRRTDRAVETAWRLTLSLITFAAACGAMGLLYGAFFAGIDARWAPMLVQSASAAAMSWGVWWLCSNRADLAGGA